MYSSSDFLFIYNAAPPPLLYWHTDLMQSDLNYNNHLISATAWVLSLFVALVRWNMSACLWMRISQSRSAYTHAWVCIHLHGRVRAGRWHVDAKPTRALALKMLFTDLSPPYDSHSSDSSCCSERFGPTVKDHNTPAQRSKKRHFYSNNRINTDLNSSMKSSLDAIWLWWLWSCYWLIKYLWDKIENRQCHCLTNLLHLKELYLEPEFCFDVLKLPLIVFLLVSLLGLQSSILLLIVLSFFCKSAILFL